MRMLLAAINLELGEEPPAQPIFRQHSAYRRLDQSLGFRFEHLAGRGAADPAGIISVPMVELVDGLCAGQLDLRGVDNHDKVAGVLMRGEIRTIFAAQDARGARGHSPQGAVGSVDQDPAAVPEGVLMGDADSLFGQLQFPRTCIASGTPPQRKFWRGRWDLNPRLPT